jgi:hypothetical protein
MVRLRQPRLDHDRNHEPIGSTYRHQIMTAAAYRPAQRRYSLRTNPANCRLACQCGAHARGGPPPPFVRRLPTR